MQIAVLSGKGGTGKTFVSTNLVHSVDNISYVDCDIEEPNGHLFLKPKNIVKSDVTVEIPVVDDKKCIGCRDCVQFCKFNALAYTGDKLLVFEEMCHSCGGCILFCKQNALKAKDHTIGTIEKGNSAGKNVYTGSMNIGEASGTPIIEALLEKVGDEDAVIDSPPGSACTVMDSIKDVDYCIVVLEPTVFGLENFKMIQELLELYEKPYGVVINKYYEKENIGRDYCKSEGIEILLEIPYSEEIGNYNSKGLIISEEKDEYRLIFNKLFQDIRGRFKV